MCFRKKEQMRISGDPALRPDSAASSAENRQEPVAELAAEGRSNKEIAAVLFVSVHTIEAHLSHAYAKLGVRSRGQLAARLSQGR